MKSLRSPYVCLSVLDSLISLFVVAPLVVGYWRGTWGLLDLYVYPDRPDYSSFMCTGIGVALPFFFTLIQQPLKSSLEGRTQSVTYYVVSRLYTAVFSFGCVNNWRGIWKLVDHYTGVGIHSSLASLVVGVVALSALRTLKNVGAPPLGIAMDYGDRYFTFPTMFRISGSQEKSLYVLDCLFSVVVVGTLGVFAWRGAWSLVDIYLFPERPDWSAWGSLALGYSIVIFAFSLQVPLRSFCAQLKGFPKIILVDIYLFFSFWGTINVWRGIWNLLNLYFLKDDPATSYWVTHIACLVLLILLNCANSIMVRGVYIDAEEEGGRGVVFDCYYLRRIFKEKKRQHQQRNRVRPAVKNRKGEIEKFVANHPAVNHVHVPLMGLPLDVPDTIL